MDEHLCPMNEKDDAGCKLAPKNGNCYSNEYLNSHNNSVFNDEDNSSSDIENLDTSKDEVFQTPLSVCSFANGLASSTPLTNGRSTTSCSKSDYKTPGRKRNLFQNALNNCTPFSSKSAKFWPVSSPTGSEVLKLNDSRFFSSGTSFTCNSNNSLFITCENMTVNSETNLCKTNDSLCLNDNLNNCDASLNSSENCPLFNDSKRSIDLKFKSSDLLPGIKPLNDSDV